MTENEPKEKDDEDARAWFIMVGLICLCSALGNEFGATFGWATFGAVLILLGVFLK